MFGLLSTLAEMLASYGQRLFDGRRARRDIEVAAELVDVVVALQDLAVRGERLLALADSFVAGAADPGAVRTFGELLDAQLAALARLGERLRGSAALLATVDPAFGMDLAILLDGKSGLLTRWQQQMGQSRFSTTTLFFLPADAVREVFDVGRTQIDATGLDTERTEYVAALSDAVWAARSAEVRDLRAVPPERTAQVRARIDAARAEVGRIRELCVGLLATTEQAVGAQAVAGLRRRQLRP